MGGKVEALLYKMLYANKRRKKERIFKSHHFAAKCNSSKDHKVVQKFLNKMLGYLHGLYVLSHGLCFNCHGKLPSIADT